MVSRGKAPEHEIVYDVLIKAGEALELIQIDDITLW